MRESVQSIAQAARRTGSVVVVLGPENTKVLCELNLQRPSGLAWFMNGAEVTAAEVVRMLDTAQGSES